MGYLKDSIHQVFYLSFFTPLCGSVTSTSNSGAPHASDGQRGDTPVEQSSRTRPGNTPELRRISACRTPPQVALASAPTVVARPVYCTVLIWEATTVAGTVVLPTGFCTLRFGPSYLTVVFT